MAAPLVDSDLVQDIAFGITFVVAAYQIIKPALARQLATAVTFFVAAASAYLALYL